MADDDEIDEAKPEAPPGPPVLKWAVALGVSIFLAVLAAQVTAPIVTQMLQQSEEEAADEELAAEEAVEPAAPAEVDFTELEPAIYVPLDPPLLASFETADGTTRYLQMSLQAMGRSQAAMDAVRQHAPAIRNAFLFLLSNHSYEDVATAAGKEQLRAEMLAEAQAILRRNIGEPGIEEIYFTSLVVQ